MKHVRIGIVGAGDNTRRRHIPGLRAVPGVEVVGVVNRTPESTAKVAAAFQIPRQYPDWQTLVADPDVDAIVIGTWPNLHCDITCAALQAGKHVLTEARMARNVAEAKQMVAVSKAHPQLVAMVVPSPYGLVSEHAVRNLLEARFIGDPREIVVLGADAMFQDYTQLLHWRQDAAISGINTLALGILHESLLRWMPQPTRVFAQTQIFEPKRPAPDGPGQVAVTVPDSVQILTQAPGGIRGLYHISGIAIHGPGKQIHLYGSQGTIKVLFDEQETVLIGRPGDTELRPYQIADHERGGWRVEAEFIAAIRGDEQVSHNDFATALRYMEFTEAVAQSAKSGLPVNLPGTTSS